jgi:hypothetical protein
MYRCLLLSSGTIYTVKMDYEENMENACYGTNDDTLIILCCCIKSVTVLLCL